MSNSGVEDESVDEVYNPHLWVGERFVVAQSWWLASELVRRHPGFVIHEVHPGDGMYDVLCIAEPSNGGFYSGTRILLNRAGSIQVHHADRAERAPTMVGTWLEVMDSSNPHEFVKRIETIAGLGSPVKTPASTPRSLTYRFISTALTMLVNDRHRWDARNRYLDAFGFRLHEDDDLRRYLAAFPSALRDLDQTARMGLPDEPYSHFWAVLRDNQPVAIASIEGAFYLRDRTCNLVEQYSFHNRNMHAMVADLLLSK